MDENTGKFIIYIGVAILLAGVSIYLFHDKLHWLGNLPGDIKIKRENVRFYFPLTTLIIVSLLLTIIVNIIRRFF